MTTKIVINTNLVYKKKSYANLNTNIKLLKVTFIASHNDIIRINERIIFCFCFCFMHEKIISIFKYVN